MRLAEAFTYSESHKERLQKNGLALIAAVFDSKCRYAPYKFFKVEFDPADEIETEGPWYSLEYFGGQLREGGSAECGDGYGGSTIEEAFSNAIGNFPILESTAFIEMADIDIDICAEYLLPTLIDCLPESNKYWPSKKDQFEKLCLDALKVRNQMDRIDH